MPGSTSTELNTFCIHIDMWKDVQWCVCVCVCVCILYEQLLVDTLSTYLYESVVVNVNCSNSVNIWYFFSLWHDIDVVDKGVTFLAHPVYDVAILNSV